MSKFATPPAVAIVGATGAVGQQLLACLERRKFALSHLRLAASARSAGKVLRFRDRTIAVDALEARTFDGIDIALFSAGSDISRKYAPAAVAAGAVVIDNSSAFRMDESVPLVIPEINSREIARHCGIIANPNCAAIVAITPLWAIHRRNRVRRLIVSTYQAASGGGAAAMEELIDSTRAFLGGRNLKPVALPHPYAFNLFSHNTPIDHTKGYNAEEIKAMRETKKIFDDDEIRVSFTCIRVPVLRAHSVSLSFTCERAIAPDEVRAVLAGAPGVRIVDDAARNHFPMPLDASGQDDILVGRIRQDLSDPDGRSITWFAAGDQLLKGAALNAVQIAERL